MSVSSKLPSHHYNPITTINQLPQEQKLKLKDIVTLHYKLTLVTIVNYNHHHMSSCQCLVRVVSNVSLSSKLQADGEILSGE